MRRRKTCYVHEGERPARVPKDDPMFCTLKCGCEYGAKVAGGLWCNSCQKWTYEIHVHHQRDIV